MYPPASAPPMSQPKQFAVSFVKPRQSYYFGTESIPAQFTKSKKQTAMFMERLNALTKTVNENLLFSFYPRDRVIAVATRLMNKEISFKTIQRKLGLRTKADAYKLAALALYDIHVVSDNSFSIVDPITRAEKRKERLTFALENVFYLSSQFDEDGADYHWLNCEDSHRQICKKVKTSKQFGEMMKVQYNGGTPTAEILRNHVIDPIFKNEAMLNKPVLVYIITDGEPNSRQDVDKVLMEAFALKDYYKYIQNAIEFTFVQVGTNDRATAWLQTVDDLPILKDNIDCVSDYEIEKQQTMGNEFQLTLGDWFLKLATGAIDDSFDKIDNKQALSTQDQIQLTEKTQQVAEYLLFFRYLIQRSSEQFVVQLRDIHAFTNAFSHYIATNNYFYLDYNQWQDAQNRIFAQ